MLKFSSPFFGISLIRNCCVSTFVKKIKNSNRKSSTIHNPVNTWRIYLRDLSLGHFFIKNVAGKVRAPRPTSLLIKNYVAVMFIWCQFFILLWVFNFVLLLVLYFDVIFFLLLKVFAFVMRFYFCCEFSICFVASSLFSCDLFICCEFFLPPVVSFQFLLLL